MDRRHVCPGVNNSLTGLGVFERYLSLWMALCIAVGVAIAQLIPAVPNVLGELGVAQVNLPIAVLIWATIYPMTVQVDFKSVLGVRRPPKGLTVTLMVNWLIKPLTMFGFAWLFLKGIFGPLIEAGLASEYVAGATVISKVAIVSRSGVVRLVSYPT